MILPLEPPHFGLLATRIMTVSLTLTHIGQAAHDMGEEMPEDDFAAIGIRLDLDVKERRASSSSSGPCFPRPAPALPRLSSPP